MSAVSLHVPLASGGGLPYVVLNAFTNAPPVEMVAPSWSTSRTIDGSSQKTRWSAR